MIQCQMADNCKKNEWYHTKCLTPADRVDEHGMLFNVFISALHLLSKFYALALTKEKKVSIIYLCVCVCVCVCVSFLF